MMFVDVGFLLWGGEMELEQFLAEHDLLKLSAVKLKIVGALWNTAGSMPGEWVTSASLLELTQQKYFDRRTRELRDSSGIDIETQQVGGVHCYRLASLTVKSKNPRFYLSSTQKSTLFNRDNHACQICGTIEQSGLRGLQADHRIPLSRDGGHELDNWQSLCAPCNVAKRRACQGCLDECSACHWAFPQVVGFPTTVNLPLDIFDAVQAKKSANPLWLEEVIRNAL